MAAELVYRGDEEARQAAVDRFIDSQDRQRLVAGEFAVTVDTLDAQIGGIVAGIGASAHILPGDSMTITISLPPETEARLRHFAAETGQSVEGFVERLLERVARDANGGQPTGTSAARPGSLRSDEALAPFRREVAASGMTDEELRAFFEEIREEVHREKLGRMNQAS